MTQAQTLRLIRKHRPQNADQFLSLGIKLEHLGQGAFREVYRIVGTDLVVKFPLEEENREGIFLARDGKLHTTNEVKKVTVLRELVPELAAHLPRIFYHDPVSAVLVCSYHEEYDHKTLRGEQGRSKREYHDSVIVDGMGVIITKLIRHITGMKCADLHYGNVHKRRRKRKGQSYTNAVLIDLGY